MKVAALGGEPAVGKSSVMKLVIERLKQKETGGPIYFKYGLLKGRHFPVTNVYLLGDYEEGVKFPGTDRLSMAVQPDAEKLITSFATEKRTCSILFEGDRLFTAAFLKHCADAPGVEFWAAILTAGPEEKARRHKARGDSQSERFLKGRATKYTNILRSPLPIAKFPNEIPDDAEMIAEFVIRHLAGK